MLDMLGEYPLERQRDHEQLSDSQILGPCVATPCFDAESEDSTTLSTAQPHRSDAIAMDPQTESRLSRKGKFVCGFCGRRFYLSISRDEYEKDHDHLSCLSMSRTKEQQAALKEQSAMTHETLVRYLNSASRHFLTFSCRLMRNHIVVATLVMKKILLGR